MLFLLPFLLGCSTESAGSRFCAVAPSVDVSPEATTAAEGPQGEKVERIEVTAYTSSKKETDATPCIAADMTNICRRHAAGEAICATNRYPFGTKLVIEGLGTCTVADRTHRRYAHRIDWYFGKDRAAAKAFGKRQLTVQTIK